MLPAKREVASVNDSRECRESFLLNPFILAQNLIWSTVFVHDTGQSPRGYYIGGEKGPVKGIPFCPRRRGQICKQAFQGDGIKSAF